MRISKSGSRKRVYFGVFVLGGGATRRAGEGENEINIDTVVNPDAGATAAFLNLLKYYY